MTDFLQLLVYLFAAVNPFAAAAAVRPAGSRLPNRSVGLAACLAMAAAGSAALLSDPILDGLAVEPETFRVGAGVVFLAQGALVLWLGHAPHTGTWDDALAWVSPLGVPVFATAAAVAAAVTYGADRRGPETFGAAVIAIGIAALLVALRAGRSAALMDGLARVTGALLVVVAAGLVVSGVRAI